MTNTTQQNYSFWEVIKQYHIEIPIIQRDYAQGRKGNKTENIRLEFVKVLRNALLPNADKLHLNFVYGKVSNGHFVPLDGQQRLTTLFLLHWYLAEKTNVDKTILINFSYRTRPSSKDFCQALINQPLTLSEDKKPSEVIKDASWFFTYWKKDPTVEAMLNMLDTIQAAFKEDTPENLQAYWTTLIEKKQIHFEFLDLEKFNLTDELYVKMNARGKELFPFENFKAWLMEFVEDKENKIGIREENKDWKDNLDIKWADLFWNNKGDGNYTIDEAYMNFFRNMFQIFYVQQETFKSDNETLRKKAARLTAFENNDKYAFLPHQFYVDTGVLTNDNLNTIFEIIDILSDKEEGIQWISEALKAIDFFNDDRTLFKAFVSGNMTYPDKIRFYAMMLYLIKNQDRDYSQAAFVSWMRVVRNLVENTTIDSIPTFARAIEGLVNLAKGCEDVNKKISIGRFYGFNETQLEEEYWKSIFIVNDLSWQEVFLEFENHKYFKGKIEFILKLVSINDAKDYRLKRITIIPETYQNPSKKLFKEYGEKSSRIFTHKLNGDNKFLLERALLTEYNYLLKSGSNESFVRMFPNKNKIKSWRTDFLTEPSRLIIFKQLLDKIELGDEINGIIKIIDNLILKNIIENSIKIDDINRTDVKHIKNYDEIVQSHIQINSHEYLWRKYLIEEPKLIEYCGQGFIRFYNEHNILLLGSSQLNHYHRELFSYHFYYQFKKRIEEEEINISPFENFHHHQVKNPSHLSCAFLHNYKRSTDYNYAVDISYQNKFYKVNFFNRNKDLEPDLIEDDIKLVLKELSFDLNKDLFQNDIITFITQNIKDVENLLINLCFKLNEMI